MTDRMGDLRSAETNLWTCVCECASVNTDFASVARTFIRLTLILSVNLTLIPTLTVAAIILPGEVDWEKNGYRDEIPLQEMAPLPQPEAPVPTEPRVILQLHRPEVIPAGFITIGDVAEVTGKDPELVNEVRSIDLMESPKSGAKEFIFARRIDAALRRIGLGSADFEILGPDRIALESPSQTISMEQLESAINLALNDRAMKENPGEVEAFLRRPPKIELPAGELEIKVVDLDRPGSGFRNIQLDFFVDGKKADSQSLPVRVAHSVYGLVASRDLREGDPVTEVDLTEGLIPMRERSEDDQPIDDAGRLIGSKLRKNVAAGSPITLAEVEWEPLVNQGSGVTLVHEVGSVSLTAPGVLMEPAFQVGQKVRVRKLNSRDDLVGKVLPGRKIRIQ